MEMLCKGKPPVIYISTLMPLSKCKGAGILSESGV